jgi:hypothetical protein
MNLLNLLNQVTEIDPEITERVSPRRRAIKSMTSFGSKVTLAALPFALSALFKKAYGATTLPANIADLLNMALVLERMEAGFYTRALNATNLIPADDRAAIQQILTDENHHVTFLENLLGPQAKPAPTFDYTGGGGSGIGQFRDAFTLYGSFLDVAQALEDIGVRAYQGVFPSLYGDQALLTGAFNIHSVEARHSAHIHLLQYKLGNRPAYPWIWVGDNQHSGLNNTEFYAVYSDEENPVQLGISGLGSDAFDEPMQPANVKTLVNNLFIGSPKLA